MLVLGAGTESSQMRSVGGGMTVERDEDWALTASTATLVLVVFCWVIPYRVIPYRVIPYRVIPYRRALSMSDSFHPQILSIISFMTQADVSVVCELGTVARRQIMIAEPRA